ncbi:hypothetical protein FRC03_012921 [Tulasnella sp. 419]|nr:hypothetical protein FRC03_012921 [Tulasnella sp. 419]
MFVPQVFWPFGCWSHLICRLAWSRSWKPPYIKPNPQASPAYDTRPISYPSSRAHTITLYSVSEILHSQIMTSSSSSTHREPPASSSSTPTSSRAPSEDPLHHQSMYRPLKRTYAFYLLPDSSTEQPTATTSSVLPNQSTGPSNTSNRKTRTKRTKGLPPTRFSPRLWEIKEKKRRQQPQPEPKETKPAKRRKI